jgi:hypothetical protein
MTSEHQHGPGHHRGVRGLVGSVLLPHSHDGAQHVARHTEVGR